MAGACIRHTELPSATRLFTDLVYDYPRVARFYPYRPHPDSAEETIRELNYSAGQRRGLVDAIRTLNTGVHSAVEENLDRLSQAGTVAVTTGQQVGLYGGPAFAIYKALSAVRMAEDLNGRGHSAVPVFWLATEDHDAAEVNHAWIYDGSGEPVRLEARAGGEQGQPVGARCFESLPEQQLGEALAGFGFGDEILGLLRSCYSPSATFGEAFASLLQQLMGRFGILLIDPMSASVRRLAAPLLERALEEIPELAPQLAARSAALEDAGYHAQVRVTKESSLLFVLRDGQRTPLRRQGTQFHAPGASYSAADLKRVLADAPEQLSPNALLRPVVQDYLLPTAVYIGGPAELAYLAQSEVLYQRLLGHMPVALPRASFTLLDPKSRKRLKHYGLRVQDCFVSEPVLQERIAARLVPDDLDANFDRQQQRVGAALDEVAAGLSRFDPTLADAAATSRRKIEYQIERLRRKAAREALRRDEQAGRHALHLSRRIYPHRVPQERLYSMAPFLAEFGLGVLDPVYAAISPDCHDHQVLNL